MYLEGHSVVVTEENIHRQEFLFFGQWNRQVHERIIFNRNLKENERKQ